MPNPLDRSDFQREWKSVLVFLGLVLLPTLWVALRPRTQLQAFTGTVLANILIALIAWFFLRREGVRAKDIGLGSRQWFAGVLLFLVWWVAVSLIDYAAPLVAPWFGLRVQPIRPIPFAMVDLLQLVQSWIFVGIAEELAFRGYLQNKLAAIYGRRWKGAVWAAVMFSFWRIPGSFLQGGQTFLTLLVNALIFAVFSFVLFNLTYEWTGLLPFLMLVHGWNDDLLMMNLQSPNIAGVIAGYLLIFVFLGLYMIYWPRLTAKPDRVSQSL